MVKYFVRSGLGETELRAKSREEAVNEAMDGYANCGMIALVIRDYPPPHEVVQIIDTDY